MAYCPNCASELPADAAGCESCHAVFRPDGWAPLKKPPQVAGKSSVVATLLKLALVVAGLAAIAFAMGLAATYVIPGCHCDEGVGCRGCGVDALVEVFLFGGFVVALFMLGGVVPFLAIIGGITAAFSRSRG